MGALKLAGTVSSHFLLRGVRVCVAQGARMPVLLAHMGITEIELKNPSRRFLGDSVVKLFEAAAQELNDPAVGLLTGLSFKSKGFSDIGYGSAFGRSFAEIMEWATKNQWLNQSISKISVERGRAQSRLIWELPDGDKEKYRSLIEVQIASAILSAREVTGGSNILPFVKIGMQHANPGYAAAYEAMFGCGVLFDQPQAFVEFDSQFLDMPLGRGNLEIRELVDAQYQKIVRVNEARSTIGDLCYVQLLLELDKSSVTIANTARALELSPRTLRRRLDNAGLRFSDILEKVRRDVCNLYFLEGKRSIGEIARLLGYSERSAFTRAYTLWYGVPPSHVANTTRKAA